MNPILEWVHDLRDNPRKDPAEFVALLNQARLGDVPASSRAEGLPIQYVVARASPYNAAPYWYVAFSHRRGSDSYTFAKIGFDTTGLLSTGGEIMSKRWSDPSGILRLVALLWMVHDRVMPVDWEQFYSFPPRHDGIPGYGDSYVSWCYGVLNNLTPDQHWDYIMARWPAYQPRGKTLEPVLQLCEFSRLYCWTNALFQVCLYGVPIMMIGNAIIYITMPEFQYHTRNIRTRTGRIVSIGWTRRIDERGDRVIPDVGQTRQDDSIVPISRALAVELGMNKCAEESCNIYTFGEFEGLCSCCLTQKYKSVENMAYSTDVITTLQYRFARPAHPIGFIPPQHVLLGCELEYNCAPAQARAAKVGIIKDLMSYCIFKSDGSLNDGGFEIVTIPNVKDKHIQRFTPVFAKWPAAAVSSSATGMHIHMDRAALTPLILGRMIDFMHAPANKAFLELVAERNLTTYCSQADGASFIQAITGLGHRGSLNTGKAGTIEFRIFKSPLTLDSFAKNLEFVLALYAFLMTGNLGLSPKQTRLHSVFIDFLKQHNRSKLPQRNFTPYLMQYLKAKGVW